MSDTQERYGIPFPKEFDDAQIERAMLRQGGYYRFKGEKLGLGLFEHFKRYWAALWPDDGQTKWTDLILREVLENKFVGLIGPASSWKSGTVARLALMDWSLFPEYTTVLMSSTDMEALRAKIYGETSKMWKAAHDHCDWFPGHPLDYRCVIANDDIEEDKIRDLRNGIIGVPNKAADGKVQGMSKFAGRKNIRFWTVCDEVQFCVLGHMMVDTDGAPVQIRDVAVGDVVRNAVGFGVVTKTHKRTTTECLVSITTKDGRNLVCTENHKILTQKGWIKACEVSQLHYIVSAYEAMQIVRGDVQAVFKSEGVRSVPSPAHSLPELREGKSRAAWLSEPREESFLQRELRGEISPFTTGSSPEDLYQGEGRKVPRLNEGGARPEPEWRKKFLHMVRNDNCMKSEGVRNLLSESHRRMGIKPLIRGGNGTGPTRAELVLKKLLPGSKMNHPVRTGMGNGSGYPTHYKLDVAIPQLKLGVEADGVSHGLLKRKEQDAKKTAFLAGLGWTVLRYSNRRILEDTETVRAELKSIISRLQATPATA